VVKTNVYSCTKPIQWFNVENLFQSTKGEKNILFVLAFFPNVVEFVEKIKKNFPHWDHIYILKNRFEVSLYLLKIRPDILYIDADYGFKGYLQTLFYNGDVFVYEEGIGTYFFDVKSLNVSPLKVRLFNIIGAGKFLGGHYKTKGIHVYNTYYYKTLHPDYSREVLQFKFKFEEQLSRIKNELSDLFSLNEMDFLRIKNKKILIYATNHSLNQDIVAYIDENSKGFDKIFIKPHPQLVKDKASKLYDLKYELILENVMLELLIMRLIITNKVTVLHESSTGCIYFTDSDNLTLVNFGGPIYPFFNSFKESLLINN